MLKKYENCAIVNNIEGIVTEINKTTNKRDCEIIKKPIETSYYFKYLFITIKSIQVVNISVETNDLILLYCLI